MAYIILLKAALHNAKLKTAYHDSVNEHLSDGGEIDGVGDPPPLCTPKTFAKSYEVNENFINKKGNKNKILVTKAMIFDELKTLCKYPSK